MQSRIDSMMESVVNVIIGLVVSTVANQLILTAVLGVSMTIGQNVLIGAIFTLISIGRSYTLRRAFNGKSVWEAIKGRLFDTEERLTRAEGEARDQVIIRRAMGA